MNKKFYCSLKWDMAAINLVDRGIAQCCRSTWETYDLTEATKNIISIFNTADLKADRQTMLDGQVPASCKSCVELERNGITAQNNLFASRNKNNFTSEVQSQLPSRIDFGLHNFCNLTCVYCSPFFSSSWTKDIKENGEYKTVGKTIAIKDMIKNKIPLSEFEQSESFTVLKNIVNHHDFINVKHIYLAGGEPLLNPYLLAVVKSILDNNPTVEIWITTGLGVPDRTFYATIEKLKNIDSRNQIGFNVSAESTGAMFEFIRAGIKWSDFHTRLTHLIDMYTVDRISIWTVLFILGLFDYKNFLLYIKDLGFDPKLIQFGYLESPPYLSLLSFDSTITKPYIDELLATDLLSNELRNTLTATLATQVADSKLNLQFVEYITEFASRRNLDINIFPIDLIYGTSNKLNQ